MEESYTIETGIPIPEKINVGYASKYPFYAMAVGDSFFVPCVNSSTGSVRTEGSIYRMVMSAASNYRNRCNRAEQHHTARIVDENGRRGVRIWRDK